VFAGDKGSALLVVRQICLYIILQKVYMDLCIGNKFWSSVDVGAGTNLKSSPCKNEYILWTSLFGLPISLCQTYYPFIPLASLRPRFSTPLRTSITSKLIWGAQLHDHSGIDAVGISRTNFRSICHYQFTAI